MKYFTFFSTKSSKAGVYFTLTVHLNWDLPHFKCSITLWGRGCYIGQGRFRGLDGIRLKRWRSETAFHSYVCRVQQSAQNTGNVQEILVGGLVSQTNSLGCNHMKPRAYGCYWGSGKSPRFFWGDAEISGVFRNLLGQLIDGCSEFC